MSTRPVDPTSPDPTPPSGLRSASSSLTSTSLESATDETFSRLRYYDNSDHEVIGDVLTPHISHISECPRRPALSRLATGRSGVSVATTNADAAYEVDWDEDGDEGDPKEWPFWYKGWILATISFSTTTVVLYSSAYASGIPGMMVDLHVGSEPIAILGLTTYLFGLAVGSVILAPLSEMYGRRPIYLVTMSLFVILVLPCALAENIATILAVRFFVAVAGSALVANAPGSVHDISAEEYRALNFSIWSIGPMNGPVIGPIIGGFVFDYLGWRWINWVVMICGGVALGLLATVKETYAPAILRKRTRKRRRETGEERWWCRYDEKKALWPLLKVNLSRPFVMAVTEPICVFWDLYIAVVYAILYLCFTAYPIIFSDLRGWDNGVSGLAFCGIGIGCLITIASEPLIRRLINAHKNDPETGRPPPEAMVSIVCLAAVLIPLGELWFAWTCYSPSRPPDDQIHWIWPILAGVPFGAGNGGVFIYATNYLVHSYGIYAASALAGNTVVRSVAGGTLPLAGPAMYRALGPNWAGTMLGLMELVLAPIPFIFWKYGHRIREKSTLIRRMQADNTRVEERRERARKKREKVIGKSEKVLEKEEGANIEGDKG